LKLPADARNNPVTRSAVLAHFSVEPVAIAASTSSAIDELAFRIAHPERFCLAVLIWLIKPIVQG
jgi:hypothetical protein